MKRLGELPDLFPGCGEALFGTGVVLLRDELFNDRGVLHHRLDLDLGGVLDNCAEDIFCGCHEASLTALTALTKLWCETLTFSRIFLLEAVWK